jgi:hypothetical protein
MFMLMRMRAVGVGQSWRGRMKPKPAIDDSAMRPARAGGKLVVVPLLGRPGVGEWPNEDMHVVRVMYTLMEFLPQV